MHKIIADVPLSRRLRLHYVINNCAEVAYTSKSLAACVNWLYEQGEREFLLELEHGRMQLKIVNANL